MIVVVGRPEPRVTPGKAPLASGLAASIARSAAATGADVELVARVRDDPTGDSMLLGLARDGVGHVATLRDPSAGGAPLEAADLDLALRYLDGIRAIVLADATDPAIAATASSAAAWSGATLVGIVPEGSPPPEPPEPLDPTAIVLEAPRGDPGDAFGAMVGRLAAALDAGESPETAFRTALEAGAGWTPVSPED